VGEKLEKEKPQNSLSLKLYKNMAINIVMTKQYM
jgi:hypothetical protein